MKKTLTKKVWSKDSYYKVAEQGSLDFEHPAMKLLVKLAKNSKNILDMGCGEGTRLGKIIDKKQKGTGVDISTKAIDLAKKKFPKLNFAVGDLEKLPFANKKFDLVYSAFVLEHLDNPGKVIKEGIRVLKKEGMLLMVAPNFGAPNRASPPFKGNRFRKLLFGFLQDLFLPFRPKRNLNWRKVKPIADKNNYQIDWDTVVEPYLGSLVSHVSSLGLEVVKTSSCWEEEGNAGLMQKIFRFLGRLNIYPFSYWGPHLLLLAKK